LRTQHSLRRKVLLLLLLLLLLWVLWVLRHRGKLHLRHLLCAAAAERHGRLLHECLLLRVLL
jgi:hypothetical protein